MPDSKTEFSTAQNEITVEEIIKSILAARARQPNQTPEVLAFTAKNGRTPQEVGIWQAIDEATKEHNNPTLKQKNDKRIDNAPDPQEAKSSQDLQESSFADTLATLRNLGFNPNTISKRVSQKLSSPQQHQYVVSSNIIHAT